MATADLVCEVYTSEDELDGSLIVTAVTIYRYDRLLSGDRPGTDVQQSLSLLVYSGETEIVVCGQVATFYKANTYKISIGPDGPPVV